VWNWFKTEDFIFMITETFGSTFRIFVSLVFMDISDEGTMSVNSGWNRLRIVYNDRFR
jgi:hypothetical protein